MSDLSGALSKTYFPGFGYSRTDGVEAFVDPETGFHVEWNTGDETDTAGTIPHCGRLVQPQTIPAQIPPQHFALFWNTRANWYDWTLPAYGVPNNELHDTTPTGSTTGDGRRFFIACAGKLAAMGDPKAFQALMDWNLDQLKRPLGHDSMAATRNAYVGTLKSGWTSGTKALNGWDAYNREHIDLCVPHAAALAGLPIGLMNLFLVGRFVYAENPPTCSSWRGSDRSAGMTLRTFVHLFLLAEMDQNLLDEFFDGQNLRQVLRAYVDEFLEHLPRTYYGGGSAGGFNVNARMLPIVKDPEAAALGFPSGSEVTGGYAFQQPLLLLAIMEIERSGILAGSKDSSRMAALRKWATDRAADYARRCLAIQPNGLAWQAYGFSQREDFATGIAAACDKYDTNGKTYEEVQQAAGFSVRTAPAMTSDVGLHLAVLAYYLGVDNPYVLACDRSMANLGLMPGGSKWSDKNAGKMRVLEPYLALKNAAAEEGLS